MNVNSTWHPDYEYEIAHARLARQNGNEGMARVCARRAAGILIGEYLYRRGFVNIGTSAYDRLAVFDSLPDVDEELKTVSKHFLLKVDAQHNLPVEVDLVVEAEWLAEKLLLEITD